MLKAFRGQPFEHTHENKIFDALYDALAEHCIVTEQDWTLLGNFYVGNRELDAVLVKQNALIVIDFKDYAGKLSLSEDGPWLIEDTASGESTKVKGGSSVNPLVQLRQNKFALVSFMEKVNKNCNWGHIAAIVLFHGAIEFDAQQIPGNCKPWLHIAGMRDAVRAMEAIVSREIHIEPKDIQYIVDWFELTPFIPAGAVKSRLLVGPDAASSDDVQQPTPIQQQALAEFSGWLQNPKGAFRLLGMASTGKRFLFPFLVGLIKKSGRRPILLAPNARHVGNYMCRDDIQQNSIYTWLYSQKPTRFEEKNGLKVAVHDVRKDIDITGVLPVLADAHLMSDKNPGLSDRRYGSGYLITDFLELMGEAPFVAIGDPYQMPRGSMSSLIPPDSITEMTKTHLLNGQILARQQDEAVQALQAHLVDCITKESFNLLPKFSGGNLEIVENDSDRRWTPGAEETLSPKSVLLCSRREQANYVNAAVKTCRLGHSDSKRLGVGELVEFYTSTPILKNLDTDDLGSGPQWIPAGAVGIIDKIAGHIEMERQPLSGRQDPVIIRSEVASCRVAGIGEVEIRYLVDFYEAEKAELSVDYMIALQVLARKKAKPFLEAAERMLAECKAKIPRDKNDPGYAKAKGDYDEANRAYDQREYNVIQSQGFAAAARIRPAYALTVHRAQGRQWPFARLSASPPPSGAAYTNEGYFRWLYTATTCAYGQLLVQDFPKIDSMLNAIVKQATNASIGPISVKSGLQYDKARIPTKAEEASELPIGFSDVKLIPLMLELKDRLQNSAWRMISWKDNNYQVLLTLLSDASDAEVKVRLDYDGSLSVTNISYPDAQPKDRDAVNTLLARPFIPASQALAEALNGFLARVVPCGFQLLSAKETNYRIMGVLGKDEDKVAFELDADKKGMVGSVRLMKATTEHILVDVEHALRG